MLVSIPTIHRALKKIGLTRKKKTYGYKERNEEKRAQFARVIVTKEPKELVYIDESGIEDNRFYGWSQKGKRLFVEKPGYKRIRVSIIGALNAESTMRAIVTVRFLKPMLNTY